MSAHALKTGLLVLAWTVVYYLTSAYSGIWNKELVGAGGVSPTVLTLLHLLVSLGSDIAVMRYSKEGVPSFPPTHGRHTMWDIVRCFLPVAVFVTLSKLTTYMSYQHVSVSLSHTAKASEPIWNVVVAALVFGEFYSQPVYLALAPIAVGVALASVTDFTYNHTGFFWAVVSAIMKVLQVRPGGGGGRWGLRRHTHPLPLSSPPHTHRTSTRSGSCQGASSRSGRSTSTAAPRRSSSSRRSLRCRRRQSRWPASRGTCGAGARQVDSLAGCSCAAAAGG